MTDGKFHDHHFHTGCIDQPFGFCRQLRIPNPVLLVIAGLAIGFIPGGRVAPTAAQNAQILIGRFRRDLLPQVHKEGRFSDAAIRELERDLDIDELKLNQLFPKDDQSEPKNS